MSVDLAQVMRFLKEIFGSNAHLAEALGYTERTIQDWVSKDRDYLDRLSPEKKKNILTLAEAHGLEPDRHAQGPMLWDPELSFDKNSQRSLPQPPSVLRPLIDHKVSFLGFRLGSPLGVGPSSLTSNVGQVRFWASSGVDVITVRTVRSGFLPPLGRPNLHVAAHPVKLDGEKPVDVEVAGSWDPGKVDNGILSLFLGSSPPPEVWQANFHAAALHLSRSQLLILSVIGGAPGGLSELDLIKDWEVVSRLGAEAGAKVIELNLSAPRSAGGVSTGEKPLCFDLALTAKVCAAVRAAVGDTIKILLKVRSMPHQELQTLVEKTIACGYADGVSAVNGEGARPYVRRASEKFQLWGDHQEVYVGGKPLLPFGIRCVNALAEIRAHLGLKDMAIVGLGGVSTFQDFQAYRQNGADVVQVVSQCFADSYGPYKLRKSLDDHARKESASSEHEYDMILLNFAKAARAIEKYQGMTQAKKEKVQRATLDEMLQWMRRRDATSALGPMRSKPTTVEDCIRLIQARLI